MKKLFVSILFAIDGLRYAFTSEKNFKIELSVALIVICMGLLLSFSYAEWLIVLLNIGAVLSAEIFNTAIEKACDFVADGLHPLIKIIKDTAAGAVLVTGIIAAICGVLIFGKHIIILFQTV